MIEADGGVAMEKKGMRWYVCYVVGNAYKVKYVWAENCEKAIKKARVKNIVDLRIDALETQKRISNW